MLKSSSRFPHREIPLGRSVIDEVAFLHRSIFTEYYFFQKIMQHFRSGRDILIADRHNIDERHFSDDEFQELLDMEFANPASGANLPGGPQVRMKKSP